MNKLISFIVPSYNAEGYISKCIDSLLVARKMAEIIIVDDGSTDQTGKIADQYQKKYPTTIKVIHKENGGHGSGVNVGLEQASGIYFKVVDSDDWLNESALKKLMTQLEEMEKKNSFVDLIVCNYVYNHTFENKERVMSFRNVFPKEKVMTWKDIKHFKVSQYLIMHALIYKTSVLRQSKLHLPLHTFYVDNIVAYVPLPFVKNILYLDIDLYEYFIGRSDQSVTEENMMKRIDQQIKVTKIIIDSLDLEKVKEIYPKLYKYLLRMLSMMMTISSVYLLMRKEKESLEKREELWNYLKKIDEKTYKKIRWHSLAGLTYFKSKFGRWVTITGYKWARKVYKFN